MRAWRNAMDVVRVGCAVAVRSISGDDARNVRAVSIKIVRSGFVRNEALGIPNTRTEIIGFAAQSIPDEIDVAGVNSAIDDRYADAATQGSRRSSSCI